MIFYNVTKWNELLDVIKHCKGVVYLRAKNGTYVDLREWLLDIKMLLWTFGPKVSIETIDVKCEYEEDLEKVKACLD